MNVASAEEAWSNARTQSSNEMVMAAALDLTSRGQHRGSAARDDPAVRRRRHRHQHSGDLSDARPIGQPPEDDVGKTLAINVTSNHVLAARGRDGARRRRSCPRSIVLTSSANAVVPKAGSEPYDVSKAAINHLIRELAIGLGPLVRVNGIAPATVVAGSAMFPRDRVIGSLQKYGIAFTEDESTEALRGKLAEFYAQRTITRRPILPVDCANAICWLAGDQSAKTTGHVIPVDGGLAGSVSEITIVAD